MLYTLDAESTRLLVDSRLQSPELVRLRLIKARRNLEELKKKGLSEDELLDIEDRLLGAEFNADQNEENAELQKYETKHKSTKNEIKMDELNMVSSELRQRNVHHSEDKIMLQHMQQNQLSSDLLEMTARIKKNAQLFQQKLDADNDLMSQTGEAIQRTASTMSKVGSQLNKYRKESVGWRFYIMASVFIFLVAFFGMFIIQIFGKW